MSLKTFISKFFTKVVSDVDAAKKGLEAAAAEAPAIFGDIVKDEQKLAPVIEALVPGSTAVIATANAILTAVETAVEGAGEAAGANGLSVTLDQTLVNDVKQLLATAKKAL
jgi:hypothetical protein